LAKKAWDLDLSSIRPSDLPDATALSDSKSTKTIEKALNILCNRLACDVKVPIDFRHVGLSRLETLLGH